MKLATCPPCVWNFNTNLSCFRPFLVGTGVGCIFHPLPFFTTQLGVTLVEVVGCITFGPNFSPRKHLGNCTGTKIFSQGVACSSAQVTQVREELAMTAVFFTFWGRVQTWKSWGFPSQHPLRKVWKLQWSDMFVMDVHGMLTKDWRTKKGGKFIEAPSEFQKVHKLWWSVLILTPRNLQHMSILCIYCTYSFLPCILSLHPSHSHAGAPSPGTQLTG